jgi:hypothetical protein
VLAQITPEMTYRLMMVYISAFLCRIAAVISLFEHWIYSAHSPIMERTAAFP